MEIKDKIKRVRELANSRGENADMFDVVKLMQYFAEIEGLKWKPIPSYGDLMPISEWLKGVQCGGYIDYDGHGNLSNGTEESNVVVQPSDITEKGMKLPEWATHIVWFNR